MKDKPEGACRVRQRHDKPPPTRREFAGAAEDQRRLRTFSPASGNGAVLPLPHSVQGLTSVETGDRWSSGGRCCQRFSRFRRAATRYYAAEPARTDLHRSAHRDAASPAAVAVPWHSRNGGVPPLVLRCSSGHTVHLRATTQRYTDVSKEHTLSALRLRHPNHHLGIVAQACSPQMQLI